MTHRYGRHGNKAWLRWRKKHLRRTSLIQVPQVAVLHVPFEFLSRIRKVIILMTDGTEQIVEVTTDSLPSPTVDADNAKGSIVVTEQIESPHDQFFAAAKELAREQAERTFRSAVDPYSAKLYVTDVRGTAQSIYYVNTRLMQQWTLGEARDHFLREFRAEYQMKLSQLSTTYGAAAAETRKLLIFARTDKFADGGTPPTYAQDRAFARACISLFSDLCQEDINEDVLRNLSERTGLYQKFYDEFEPAKEED